jgi:hypothetical protein
MHTLLRAALFAVIFSTCALWAAAQSRLNVITDERMELLNTVQYLSGYPILTPAKLRYKDDIEAYFGKHRNHPAVLMNKAIYRRFFGFDIPIVYVYHHSFPDFKQVAAFTKDDAELFGFDEHADSLAIMRRELRAFYKDANFHAFYVAHKKFYDSLIQPVKAALAKTDAIKIMEAHYGMRNKAYNIVLAPLEHDGGYGPQVAMPDGNVVYAIVGPRYTSVGFPEFDIGALLSEYVLHEFSHSFCNPQVNKYRKVLERDSCLLRPIRQDMKEQGYGNWYACVIEHFTRANEIILTEKVLGKKEADEKYKDMLQNGQWIYLEGLVPLIRKYAANRTKYKTIADIMPEAVAYFDVLARGCK